MTRVFLSTTSFCSGCPSTSGLHHDHRGGNLRRLDLEMDRADDETGKKIKERPQGLLAELRDFF
jgi:hypothetical protein